MAKYRKRKDGRYAANILIGYAADGKKKYAPTIYARSIQELETKKAEVKEALRKGIYANDKGITLGEWSVRWLETYKTGVAAATRDNYRYTLPALAPIADKRLRDLTKSELQLLLNSLSDKPETARMTRLTLRQILDTAVDDGLIYKNVAVNLVLPTARAKTEKRPLTKEEVRAISQCDFSPIEKAWISMLYYTGIRRGEGLALAREDIDLKSRIIHIRHSLTWADGKTEIKVPKSKSSVRDLPITDGLLSVLRDYLSDLEGDVIFPKPEGGYMAASSYKRLWRRIKDKVNTKLGGANDVFVNGRLKTRGEYKTDMTAHMLRHNYATMLYYAEVEVNEAKKLLGHSSIVVTLDIYTHLSEGNSKVLDQLNKIEGL